MIAKNHTIVNWSLMAQSLRLYEQRIGYTPKSLLPITKMKKKKKAR